MICITDLFSFSPRAVRDKINEICDHLRRLNLVEGDGIKLNKLPSGTVISSQTTAAGGGGASSGYNGMWKVELVDGYFQVPSDVGGNIILTEDRLFATVTDPLVSDTAVSESGWSWCYLVVDAESDQSITTTGYLLDEYEDYQVDYIPLAGYSPETGLIQLQYGPVRINRYWLNVISGGGEA